MRKSRFIGIAAPAKTVAAADSELRHIKEQHSSASHVVHAYLVGAPEREIGSLTDAGEPKGTAGRPVMEILRGSNVRNVVVAVVRYYGGTKLGTGGLVHAYGDTARLVLGELRTRPLVLRERLSISVDYSRHEPVRRALADIGADLVAEEFDTAVRMVISLDRERVEELVESLRDLTAGTAEIERQKP